MQIGVGEIEDEVEREGERDEPRERSGPRLIKDGDEGDRDDDIEDAPHGTKEPRRRRPYRLYQLLIRGV